MTTLDELLSEVTEAIFKAETATAQAATQWSEVARLESLLSLAETTASGRAVGRRGAVSAYQHAAILQDLDAARRRLHPEPENGEHGHGP